MVEGIMIRTGSHHSQHDNGLELGRERSNHSQTVELGRAGSLHRGGSMRESLTRGGEEKEGADPDPTSWSFQNFIRPAASSLSASFYLFDFVSNILVLKEYYQMHSRREDNIDLSTFAVCLGLMVIAHIGNVVAFKLKLPPDEHPLRSAYFLPIVQFRRVVTGIWKAGSFGRTNHEPVRSESLETESLYAIMSAAMETGPQLGLQVCVVVSLGSYYPDWRPSYTLIVSIVASFISGSYNTARAVMYQLSERWTWTLNVVGVFGGVYTLGALLLRCLGVASVILYLEVNIQNVDYNTGVVMYFLLGVVPVSLLNGVISLGRTESFFTSTGQLHAWIGAYISFTLGPLYPVVDGYARDKKLEAEPSLIRLPIAVLLNLLLDIGTLTVITVMKWNACNYKQNKAFEEYPDELSWALQPALSSTLTCASFVGYAATGLLLTLISSGVLFGILITSSSTAIWGLLPSRSPGT